MNSKYHNLLIEPLKSRQKLIFGVFHHSSFISLTSKFGRLEVLNFLILEVTPVEEKVLKFWYHLYESNLKYQV